MVLCGVNSVMGVMWCYVVLFADMSSNVVCCGVMCRYLALFGVMWRYVALCGIMCVM